MSVISACLGVARAPFLLLPVTLVALGAAAGASDGAFDITRTLLALVGLVALHVAVNAFNEVSDFRSGIDLETERTPFSGGSGTLPAGRIGVRAGLAVAWSGVAVGAAVGAYFLVAVGLDLLPIFAIGALAALAYSDLLARLYIGEFFAGLGLGALPVIGTAMVQGGGLGRTALVAAVPAFCTTYNLLLLNEFPDESADRAGGRRNLVLLLGRSRAAAVYAAVALTVPATIALAVRDGIFPTPALVGLIPSLLLIAPFLWILLGRANPVPHGALGANVAWNLGTNLFLAAGLLL
jgi:1,4-dihydroxy-2-naphthoate octaprenyltransferase